MRETRGSTAIASNKTNPKLSPKALIHQKFGINACYTVEEINNMIENDCPGFAIPRKGPCLFRCTLQLTGLSVISDICTKKKEAEQSAAAKALEKLGINLEPIVTSTIKDPWDCMVDRLSFLFSNEFVSFLHPFSGHLRATLKRDNDLSGLVPVSVMVLCDTKLSNLCKSILPEVESNPSLAKPLIIKAAERLSDSIAICKGGLCLCRQSPYPYEVIQSIVDDQKFMPGGFSIEGVHIPYSTEMTVEPLSINIPSESDGYYLDVIAQQLQVADASKVLLSRNIGKSSSELKLYFCAPESYLIASSSEEKEASKFEGCFNAKASYLCGQNVYGNAIMATIGYTWRSKDLHHEDVPLRIYYRMLISKIPNGLYKLSRDAILTADLPLTFTARMNWRGNFPKDILCSFCRHHRLLEPVFSEHCYNSESFSESPESSKRIKIEEQAEFATENCCSQSSHFRCEVNIYTKCQDLILVCFPTDFYKKQYDAVQNAALKLLSWLNNFFNELDMPLGKLKCFGDSLSVQFNADHFFKAFELCPLVHKAPKKKVPKSVVCDEGRLLERCTVNLLNIEGPDSGIFPSNGSLVCISLDVSVIIEDNSDVKSLLESHESFEFEIGTRAVIPKLEAGILQLCVGQCAYFEMELDSHELMLAAADDSVNITLLSSKAWRLKYSISLLKVTEPMEVRMEQAFFSPPLSKQRLEFALQQIKDCSARTLVDFGCGSGSLLGSLLEHPTALVKMVGVDISQKGLANAAKAMNSKLRASLETSIESVVLYEGSITEFDSRLYGFDMGTCIEVIEHMEEDEARRFGDIVLSYFSPKLLVVSTPNYEYNVLLRGSNTNTDSDERACRFRNHDHKFEWTRAQFNGWAMDTAGKHNYNVEFSGVGGCGELEPGFASQIAVFRRPKGVDCLRNIGLRHGYGVMWEWNRSFK